MLLSSIPHELDFERFKKAVGTRGLKSPRALVGVNDSNGFFQHREKLPGGGLGQIGSVDGGQFVWMLFVKITVR